MASRSIFHKKHLYSQLPVQVLSVFFFHIFHNVGHIAFQNPAQLIDCMGGNVFATLHCVVGGSGEAQFHQTVRRDPTVCHRAKQRFIADHFIAPFLSYQYNSTKHTWICTISRIYYDLLGGVFEIMEEQLIDPSSGILLSPSYHGEYCLGNGEQQAYPCCCDECDYYLVCFPDWQTACWDT